MMTENEKAPTLDDVLNELVAEHEELKAETLELWSSRYPQYRRELVEFAAAWAEQSLLGPAPELAAAEEERLVDRAMSHALNVSFHRDEERRSRRSDGDAIRSLTGDARDAGLKAGEFAKACGLDLVLVAKLNSRQLRPDTIPSRLVSHIARLLGRSAGSVMDYLRCPPQALSGRSFLSRKKPKSAERESFADAVRASSLSKAEKARWLDEAAKREER